MQQLVQWLVPHRGWCCAIAGAVAGAVVGAVIGAVTGAVAGAVIGASQWLVQ